MQKISGKVMDCLAHYAKSFLPTPGSKGAAKAKKPLSQFCGVGISPVQTWIAGAVEPVGLSLLKLMFFFEAFGYKVTELVELQETSPEGYKLAELLAYRIMNAEEAQSYLGYGHVQSVYQVAFGKSGITESRADLIRAKHKDKLAEVQAARAEFLRQLEGLPSPVSDSVPPASTSGMTQALIQEVDDALVETLAHLIQALTPMLEGFLTESSREQRSALRTRSGHNGMFRLSKVSSRLCSEKARDIV